jgi:O26-antigen biosynthesis N-acetyl-L-fucosamine transferase
MRIALLPDEYLPSGTRVHSKMFHELAITLKEKGHQPIVITPGSPLQNSRLVIDFIDDVEVWRFRCGYTRGAGVIKRAINEWLLPFRAWLAIKSRVKVNKFDLCINYAPTIFFGPLASRFKRQGTFIYLIVRDMFPQWIIDQGLIKENSLAASFFRHYEKLNYDVADCIGLQSQANLDVFTERFPKYSNVKILRNWASISALPESQCNKTILTNLGIQDKIIFFYGGNTGHAQDMENIMRLAKNLQSITGAHFLIIGQGDQFELIQSLKSKWALDNVTILPSIPQKEFSCLVATIDIGLFSLSYHHTAHNFPGKLLGYMVESKPILGSINPGNDLLDVINDSNAGYVYVNGEDKLLMDAAIKLAGDIKLRNRIGKCSRNLLLQQFSVESAAAEILASMKRR